MRRIESFTEAIRLRIGKMVHVHFSFVGQSEISRNRFFRLLCAAVTVQLESVSRDQVSCGQDYLWAILTDYFGFS